MLFPPGLSLRLQWGRGDNGEGPSGAVPAVGAGEAAPFGDQNGVKPPRLIVRGHFIEVK